MTTKATKAMLEAQNAVVWNIPNSHVASLVKQTTWCRRMLFRLCQHKHKTSCVLRFSPAFPSTVPWDRCQAQPKTATQPTTEPTRFIYLCTPRSTLPPSSPRAPSPQEHRPSASMPRLLATRTSPRRTAAFPPTEHHPNRATAQALTAIRLSTLPIPVLILRLDTHRNTSLPSPARALPPRDHFLP